MRKSMLFLVVMCCGCGRPRLAPDCKGGDCGSDAGPSVPVYSRVTAPDPLPAENLLAGTTDWSITNPATNGEIEGYASTDCAAAGDEVEISVNAQPAATQFTWSLYRLGWYGGAGARLLVSGGPLTAPLQPGCAVDPQTALLACDWPPTFSITLDPAWPSGAFLVKLHRTDTGLERYVPLVVRDHRAADLMVQIPVATWEAYNPWGGESLYEDSRGITPTGMAFQASFDRPYGEGNGAEHLLWWQQPTIAWLERHGFDVTYGTNLDLSRFTGFLSGVGAVVFSGGHDEYWAQGERDQIDQTLAAGQLSVVDLDANVGYWRVRFEPSADGRPFRVVTSYKGHPSLDPLNATVPTARFRDPPDANPEDQLFGAEYLDWQLFGAPLVIADASSWVFAGTGFQAGDQVPGLVGYEFDGIVPSDPPPPGLDALAISPVPTAEGTANQSTMVVRSLPGGQVVFDASSIYFTQGLGPEPDPRIWRAAWNVLERALAYRRPERPAPDFAAEVQAAVPPAPSPTWGGAVTTIVGNGVPGDADGPGLSAQLDWPVGVAIAQGGGLVVADTGGNRIRLVAPDTAHTVTTLAGNGLPGEIDGPGSSAEFRWPVAPVVGPDGTIYVADSDNHVIRAIAPDAAHTTSVVAGTVSRSGGYRDGPGLSAAFNRPAGLAIDGAGNLVVADMANGLIRKIANDSERTVTTVAGSTLGDLDGPGTNARFDYPTAVAVGGAGQIYVLDGFNQKLKLVGTDALRTVTTIAGGPNPWGPNPGTFADGSGVDARFLAQSGLVVGPAGQLFVADSGNDRIRVVLPGSSESDTSVCTYAGSGLFGSADGPASLAQLTMPMGLAVDPSGTLYVTVPSNGTIRMIAP
ncbi:MAG: N,N-dimethylformamidase beta subunit family domain-containing protein [Myxococcales bacterium]